MLNLKDHILFVLESLMESAIQLFLLREELKDSSRVFRSTVVGDRGASRSLSPEIGYTRGSVNWSERHQVLLVGSDRRR